MTGLLDPATTTRPGSANLAIALPDRPLASWVQSLGMMSEPALLVSGLGFPRSGRVSVLAAEPRLVFEAFDDRYRIRGIGGQIEGVGSLKTLDELTRAYGLADAESATPTDSQRAGVTFEDSFRGGLIGAVGYDLAPQLERLPRRHARDSRLPDIRFGLYDTFVIVEAKVGTATLHGVDLLGEGSRAVRRRLASWQERLAVDVGLNVEARSGLKGIKGQLRSLEPDFTPNAYQEAVARALEYIAAGDVFQINLSQRYRFEGDLDPLEVFQRARVLSPAPFAAYLAWDDMAVISASPEWFYQSRGDRIATRPIKGTRPRSDDPMRDAELARELESSPKDRAELTMIVDLERNDLGRVCRPGSVVVTEPIVLERYAQVQHLVATVEGRLRPGIGPVDVLSAMFPGGSITGAPKIRAMQIVDELERNRRSLYTGAIGYLGRGGRSAFNIAIRTILKEADRYSYQVGGGIVADSQPEAEYRETLDKARGLRLALGLEEPA